MIDEDAAHEARGEGVEVLAIFKAKAALLDELEEELVDDAGGLEDVFFAFAAEERAGDLAEVRVGEFEEGRGHFGLAAAPLVEEDRDFASFHTP